VVDRSWREILEWDLCCVLGRAGFMLECAVEFVCFFPFTTALWMLLIAVHATSGAPIVALRNGEQVICGGARVWTCDTSAEFRMVEEVVWKQTPADVALNTRLFLPDDYRPNTQLAERPQLDSKHAARRDQRAIYLHVDRTTSPAARITNLFATYASGIKLAEILRERPTRGLARGLDDALLEQLKTEYPETNFRRAVHGLDDTCETADDVLLITDEWFERAPDPIEALNMLPHRCQRIVLGFSPRTLKHPPPHLYRQWTQAELMRLVARAGFVEVGPRDSRDPWLSIRHADALPPSASE